MDLQTLIDRRIAVPETRELDIFASMLQRRGATVLRCPLVSIKDAPDPQPVIEWIRHFSNGRCDDLILLTGEGLRRLLSCIDQHAADLRPSFIEQLGRVRKITRGPKPAKALRELGLKSDLSAVTPTTEGVIESLRDTPLSGRNIGVQLYGTEPNRPLIEFLEKHGARVDAVAPYIYADASDDRAVGQLLDELNTARVDVIAFTSSSQVDRLFAIGGAATLPALAKTQVAAVGPIVADNLRRRGVSVSFMPSESFFMKPLTSTLEQALRRD
jgi:uroporphyrinogen-III synthase